MPLYTFKNKETGETFDTLISLSEREKYLNDNPQLEQVLGTTAIGDSVRLGIRRPDDGFREVLSKIHAANYKSNLKDKLSR